MSLERRLGRERKAVPARRRPSEAELVIGTSETSLLDVVDKLLNKGVMATGDVSLGVAGVDLIYVRLSAILCAADRVFPTGPPRERRRTRRSRG